MKPFLRTTQAEKGPVHLSKNFEGARTTKLNIYCHPALTISRNKHKVCGCQSHERVPSETIRGSKANLQIEDFLDQRKHLLFSLSWWIGQIKSELLLVTKIAFEHCMKSRERGSLKRREEVGTLCYTPTQGVPWLGQARTRG